jgi:hypothetical protein
LEGFHVGGVPRWRGSTTVYWYFCTTTHVRYLLGDGDAAKALRWSPAMLLHPAVRPRNLTVVPHCTVTRVTCAGETSGLRTATGVALVPAGASAVSGLADLAGVRGGLMHPTALIRCVGWCLTTWRLHSECVRGGGGAGVMVVLAMAMVVVVVVDGEDVALGLRLGFGMPYFSRVGGRAWSQPSSSSPPVCVCAHCTVGYCASRSYGQRKWRAAVGSKGGRCGGGGTGHPCCPRAQVGNVHIRACAHGRV